MIDRNPGQKVDGQKVDGQNVDGQNVDGQKVDGQNVEKCMGDKKSISISMAIHMNTLKLLYKSKESIYDLKINANKYSVPLTGLTGFEIYMCIIDMRSV